MAETSQFTTTGSTQLERVPAAVIRELAQSIAREFKPDKIILFGSYAYGEPKPWSDVDLLVVMDTPQGEAAAMRAVREALPRRSFSVDVLVRSQAEIDRRISLDDWFLEEITRKGQVLYEGTHRRSEMA